MASSHHIREPLGSTHRKLLKGIFDAWVMCDYISRGEKKRRITQQNQNKSTQIVVPNISNTPIFTMSFWLPSSTVSNTYIYTYIERQQNWNDFFLSISPPAIFVRNSKMIVFTAKCVKMMFISWNINAFDLLRLISIQGNSKQKWKTKNGTESFEISITLLCWYWGKWSNEHMPKHKQISICGKLDMNLATKYKTKNKNKSKIWMLITL